MVGSARFRRAERLRSPRDFKRLAARGRRASSRSFIMLVACREDHGEPRLGITASRRVGAAVQRNRVKRAIREWFRQAKVELDSLDVVVIARRGAAGLAASEARRELGRLTRELSS